MKIQIILASTRPGRVGERVATWVTAAAQTQSGFEVELVDLTHYDFPHFDEAISPRYNSQRQPNSEAARWLTKVGEADGYVVVTPEYNHSIPGHLKDALDYIDFQIAKKPVAIVSYGSVGGARAAEHLKGILIEAKAAVVPEAVALIAPLSVLDEHGSYIAETAAPRQALDQVLSELSWWTSTLKAGREVAALTQ